MKRKLLIALIASMFSFAVTAPAILAAEEKPAAEAAKPAEGEKKVEEKAEKKAPKKKKKKKAAKKAEEKKEEKKEAAPAEAAPAK